MHRLAIIGSYGHTNLTLDHLVTVPDLHLVAAARYRPGEQMPFLAAHPAVPQGLPVYDDYRRMLDEAQPDIVSVYTPMGRLAEVSTAAAERGCHVFSEKPLATTLAGLEALHDAATRNGAMVTAMLEFRGHSALLAVRECVASGRIGAPVLAASQKSYPFNVRDETYARRETYGGTLPFIGIHAVDWTAYATGRRFTRVSAFQGNAAHPERPGMEDHATMLLEFEGGGEAVIHCDFLRPWGRHALPWGDDRLRIVGTEATIETLDHGRAARLLTPDGTEDLPLPEPVSLLQTFVAAIRGEAPCLVPMEEAFYATRVCLLARQAADEGRVIEISV